MIFVRAKGAVQDAHSTLPKLKLTDYFTQTEEDEQVSFAIRKTVVTDADLESVEIRDEDSKAFIASLKSFTPEMDASLMA